MVGVVFDVGLDALDPVFSCVKDDIDVTRDRLFNGDCIFMGDLIVAGDFFVTCNSVVATGDFILSTSDSSASGGCIVTGDTTLNLSGVPAVFCNAAIGDLISNAAVVAVEDAFGVSNEWFVECSTTVDVFPIVKLFSLNALLDDV